MYISNLLYIHIRNQMLNHECDVILDNYTRLELDIEAIFQTIHHGLLLKICKMTTQIGRAHV